MKKYLKLLLLVPLLTVMLVTGFSTQVKADDPDYSITDVDVTAKVNRDGSLDMERQVSYDFDSTANGVYSQQNLGEGMKMQDVEVLIHDDSTGKTTPVTRNSDSGDHYELSRDGDDYKFKVYHAIDSSSFTVIYRFKITNAITNWNDTAELNYKIIGNNWGVDLDHVKATVVFPSSVPNLKAWAHGPLSGNIEVLPDEGRIVMEADNLPGDAGIEVHSIFPTSVTDQNENVVHSDHRDAVITQEADFAKQANRTRLFKYLLAFIPWLIGFVLTLTFIPMMIYYLVAGKHPKKTFELKANYDIPDINPMMAQALDRGKEPNKKGLIGLLLWMIGKRQIKISKAENGGYDLRAKDNDVLTYSVLFELFNASGKKKKLILNTKDIKKNGSVALSAAYHMWQKDIIEDCYRANYFDRQRTKKYRDHQLPTQLFFISLVPYIISSFFGYQAGEAGLSDGQAIMVVSILLMILSGLIWKGLDYFLSKRGQVYTAEGIKETEKIRGFKKMLKDIGRFKMKDVGDIVLWEEILPYAAVFGLAQKVLKQMKLEFSTEELAQLNYYGKDFTDDDYFGFERQLGYDISRSIAANEGVSFFNEHFSSSSSSSGDSGGFSSGDSGGFGGGSGDGAF